MNIDQFLSQIESSDVYRHNEAVRKLVSESRQTLVDLAHGDDRDAFKAELLKFNAQLDECLAPATPVSPEVAELIEKLDLRKQYSERIDTLNFFFFFHDKEGNEKVGDAPVPSVEQVIGAFRPRELRLAATFQEPTLLLVPETSFAAKVKALDNLKWVDGQGDALVDGEFYESDFGTDKITGWRAVIVDGAREMSTKNGDDRGIPINDRIGIRKVSRRPGEKGMERHAYAMLMMESLKKREPIDQWANDEGTYTILDDDPAMSDDQRVDANWHGDNLKVCFDTGATDSMETGARFRSSVGGDVVLNAIGEENEDENKNPVLAILKNRFDSHPDWHKGLEWADIEKSLKANPEKLVSLQKMEDAGGEPDFLMVENGDYVFCDCSAVPPKNRSNCAYNKDLELELVGHFYPAKGNAEDMAKLIGAEPMNEKQYVRLQELKPVDRGVLIWLKVPGKVSTYGPLYAKFGCRSDDKIFIEQYEGGKGLKPYKSWRAVLRVPKAI